jgi:hypothetical protein
MIGLPDGIGLVSFVSVKEIVSGPVDFAPRMSEGDESGIELFDDPIHALVIWCRPSVTACDLLHLSVDKGDRGGWLAKG